MSSTRTRQDIRNHVDKTFDHFEKAIKHAIDHLHNELLFGTAVNEQLIGKVDTEEFSVIREQITKLTTNRRIANQRVVAAARRELIAAYGRIVMPDAGKIEEYPPPYCPKNEPPGFALPGFTDTVPTDNDFEYNNQLALWWKDGKNPLPRPPFELQGPHIDTMPVEDNVSLTLHFAMVPVEDEEYFITQEKV